MALIPIIFNADDSVNTLKGKVQPEDLASFFSVLTTRKAGILNILDNPIDVVSVLDNTPVGKSTITFKAGYVSILGRLIYIQPNTQCQFSLPVAGTETGSFGIQIDLANTGANEVTWFKSTSALRTDDIVKNSATGVYQFRLYDYTANTSGVTLTNKTNEIIEGIADFLQGNNFVTKPNNTKDSSVATTEFVYNASPKTAHVKVNMGMYLESKHIGNHIWDGFGTVYAANSYYVWNGNLKLNADTNLGSAFNAVESIRLQILDGSLQISVNGKGYKAVALKLLGVSSVMSSGTFALRDIKGLQSLIGVYYGSDSNRDFNFYCHDPYRSYGANPFAANITNVYIALEEL